MPCGRRPRFSRPAAAPATAVPRPRVATRPRRGWRPRHSRPLARPRARRRRSSWCPTRNRAPRWPPGAPRAARPSTATAGGRGPGGSRGGGKPAAAPSRSRKAGAAARCRRVEAAAVRREYGAHGHRARRLRSVWTYAGPGTGAPGPAVRRDQRRTACPGSAVRRNQRRTGAPGAAVHRVRRRTAAPGTALRRDQRRTGRPASGGRVKGIEQSAERYAVLGHDVVLPPEPRAGQRHCSVPVLQRA